MAIFRRHTPALLFFLGVVFSGNVPAQNVSAAEYAEVRTLRTQYVQKQEQLKQTQSLKIDLDAQLNTAASNVQNLQTKLDEKNQALQKLQKLDYENPGLNLGDTVANARTGRDDAFRDLSGAQGRLRKLEAQRDLVDEDLLRQSKDVEVTRGRFEGKVDQLASRVVDAQVREYQNSTYVEETGVAACGDGESLGNCKQRAIEKAKDNAAARGSIVVVDSVTEVKNLKLTKEAIRSQVSASLSQIKMLEEGWKNDTERYAKIGALVTPTVTASMRAALMDATRGDVLREVGGEVRGISVAAPARANAPSAASDSYSTSPGRDLESELNRQAEESREKARQQRAVKEEKKTPSTPPRVFGTF